MLSGSDDATLRLWEVATARCVRTWTLPAAVVAVKFNPSPNVSLLAAASYVGTRRARNTRTRSLIASSNAAIWETARRGSTVYVYQPLCAPRLVQEATDLLLQEASSKGRGAKTVAPGASSEQKGARAGRCPILTSPYAVTASPGPAPVTWATATAAEAANGVRVVLTHTRVRALANADPPRAHAR